MKQEVDIVCPHCQQPHTLVLDVKLSCLLYHRYQSCPSCRECILVLVPVGRADLTQVIALGRKIITHIPARSRRSYLLYRVRQHLKKIDRDIPSVINSRFSDFLSLLQEPESARQLVRPIGYSRPVECRPFIFPELDSVLQPFLRNLITQEEFDAFVKVLSCPTFGPSSLEKI